MIRHGRLDGLVRAAERLSAQGRSKRLLVEPGVTAARTHHFSGCLAIDLGTGLVELAGSLESSAGREFIRRLSEPVRARGELCRALVRNKVGIIRDTRCACSADPTERGGPVEGDREVSEIGRAHV